MCLLRMQTVIICTIFRFWRKQSRIVVRRGWIPTLQVINAIRSKFQLSILSEKIELRVKEHYQHIQGSLKHIQKIFLIVHRQEDKSETTSRQSYLIVIISM